MSSKKGLFGNFDKSGISMMWRLATGMLALLMLFLAGCASAPPPRVEDKKLAWPPPPQQERIRFVRNIVDEQDLHRDTTATQGLVAFLTGEKVPEGHIAQPMSLAVSDDSERMYVSDSMQAAVFVFDFKNKKLAKLQGEGLDGPGGIALDANENLYVVNTLKKSVSIFGRDLKLINEFFDPDLERPLGLAIDKVNEKLYVVDTGSKASKEHSVKIYDLKGKRIGKIGGKIGGDNGEFSYPTFATVDDKGNLYVTDSMNARVQQFDANGNFTNMYGKQGGAWGDLNKPKGVAVDSFGNVYVVDSDWSNVTIYNRVGQPLLFFGGRGPIPGMMKNPISIFIDKQNRIYVGDYLNHRIGVYELVNTKPEDSFIAGPPDNPSSKAK